MGHQRALLTLLSDGRFHSGQALGATLGVSRAQVWQIIRSLTAYGVSIEAVKGLGYRVPNPISLLDGDYITSNLSHSTKLSLSQLELFFSIDSTNTYLKKIGREGGKSGTLCLAEHQSSGIGRRGHRWVSPLGRNLYLSLLWRFTDGPARLGGLSLIIAIVVIDALKSLGISGLSAKWPNDIVSDNGKVGGILMEVAGEHDGPCHVVVGIGLNIGMPLSAGNGIEQSWANITAHNSSPTRNDVAAALINHLFEAMQLFETDGPSPFLSRWDKYDYTKGKEVDVHLHDRVVAGVAHGIDERGFLVVAHGDQMSHYPSGEVSLRVAGKS